LLLTVCKPRSCNRWIVAAKGSVAAIVTGAALELLVLAVGK